MNELSALFAGAGSGATVSLEAGKVYHVRPEDSFDLSGYFCSNSASYEENPNGRKCAAAFLRDKRDIVIEGNGATILVHGKMTPLLLDHCENIAVKNLVIDHVHPTMTEFTVLKREGAVITIRVNDDCLFRAEGNRLYWRGEDGPDGKPYWEDRSNGPNRFVRLFDPVTGLTHPVSADPRILSFTRVEPLDGRTLRCTLEDAEAFLPCGTVVQTRNIVRDQVGGMLQRCKNLSFEGLRVKFMHGLGMVSQFCENVTFRDCDFTPAEGRTNAATADFFHFSGCRGQLTVERCRAWGSHDDFMNIHGTHLRVMEADPVGKAITVRFSHDQSWGFQAFDPGDQLEFIRWDTLKPYAEARVTGFEAIDPATVRIMLTDLPEGVILGRDVVENASWTPDVCIRGCEIGPLACRGILCTTRGEVVIENNRFDRLYGAAFLVEDDCNFWFESGYTGRVAFRGNEIISCNYAQAKDGSPVVCYTPKVMNETSAEYVHGCLRVAGNRFLKPASETGHHQLRFEWLRRAEITDNVFDAPWDIRTKTCGELVMTGNRYGRET